MSFPSVPTFRSMGNCHVNEAGPHARSRGAMSNRVEMLDGQSGSRSVVSR